MNNSKNKKTPHSNFKLIDLDEVCTVRRGQTITKRETKNGDVPVIAGGQQPAYFHNKSNREKNTITISGSGAYAGFVNFFSVPIFASDCSTVEVKDKTKNENLYFYYALKAAQKDIYTLSSGSAQPHVYSRDIKKIKVPCPPLSEQKQIAKTLSTIQGAIETQDKIIAKVRELKKSTMKQIFTKGLNGEKIKKTEIGEMPEGWEIETIGNLFEMKQGKSLSAKKQTGKHLKPFLRTSNVFWGKLDLSKVDKMDILPDEREMLELKKNDLLVCEGGDIGRTAIWKGELGECYYQNHLHRLRGKTDNIFPAFFMFWLQLAIQLKKTYGTFGNRTTIPNLSGKTLSQFALPFPPLSEQREIAKILQSIHRKIEQHELKQSTLENFFKTALNKLISENKETRKKN